jgi:hypothetical protein
MTQYKKFGIRLPVPLLERISEEGIARGIVFRTGPKRGTANRNKTIEILLKEAVTSEANDEHTRRS